MNTYINKSKMSKKIIIEIKFSSENRKAELDYHAAIRFLRESGFKITVIKQID